MKYEFDAVRWLRNNKGRMGTNINGHDVAIVIADEIQRLRAELAALKEAARPVVDAWREDRICEVWKGDAGISELARLCGEE